MKRIVTALIMGLILVFGMTAIGHAWGLPKIPFYRNIEKALTKERWKKPEEAKEYWRIALEKGEELMVALPDKCEYFMGSARCCYALGDYDRAIRLYERSLKIKEDQGAKNLHRGYPWVYVYLGLSYAKKGDTDMALKYWKQVPMSIGRVYGSIRKQMDKYKGQ